MLSSIWWCGGPYRNAIKMTDRSYLLSLCRSAYSLTWLVESRPSQIIWNGWHVLTKVGSYNTCTTCCTFFSFIICFPQKNSCCMLLSAGWKWIHYVAQDLFGVFGICVCVRARSCVDMCLSVLISISTCMWQQAAGSSCTEQICHITSSSKPKVQTILVIHHFPAALCVVMVVSVCRALSFRFYI